MALFDRRSPLSDAEARQAHRRRWILIPGLVVLLCVVFGIATTVGPFGHSHSDTVRQSYPGAVKKVELRAPDNGDVRVRHADGQQIETTWDLHWSYQKPRITRHREGDTLVLGVQCGGSGGWPCGADLRLALPSGVGIQTQTKNGDLRVADVDGPVSVTNESGDIKVANVTGPVDIKSRDGDVQMHDIHGDLDAELRSGGLRAHDLSGDTNRVRNRSGEIKLDFAERPSSVDVQNRSGEVTVDLPHGSPYRVNVSGGSEENNTKVDTSPTATSAIDITNRSGTSTVAYTD